MNGNKRQSTKNRRVRFLASVILSSPTVAFIYSPLLIAQTTAGIAIPFATGRFIDALVCGMPPIGPFALLALLLAARAVMTPCLQRFILKRSRDIELKLQGRILDAVMGFSPSELSALADGTLVTKLTRDAYAVGKFVNGLYPRLLVAATTMFTAGYALHARTRTLGVAFMAFIPLCLVLFLPFARRFASNSHIIRRKSDEAFTTLFDFSRSLSFLRTLDAERRFADAPNRALRDLKDGNGAMDRLSVAFGALLGFLLAAGEVAVLGTAGTFAANGLIPVGDVVVYQMLFLAAMQSVQGLVSLLPETATLREGIDSLDEILARAPPRRGGRKITSIPRLEFNHVTFAYPGAGARPVVRDFSAVFRAGKIIALVGANGTGKTTLLKLATAALEPQSGEILVDGTPMAALDEGSFRRGIGIVFQDNLLVSGSVRDNITLRDPYFRKEDVEAAVTLSGMTEVVKRLPDGLDTRIGLGGSSLSGGELQRLAIARALIRNPAILVLDEVTNHLDADARAGFGKMLRNLSAGRIVLVVSHDPALINLCDERIFCQIPEKPSYIRA